MASEEALAQCRWEKFELQRKLDEVTRDRNLWRDIAQKAQKENERYHRLKDRIKEEIVENR